MKSTELERAKARSMKAYRKWRKAVLTPKEWVFRDKYMMAVGVTEYLEKKEKEPQNDIL